MTWKFLDAWTGEPISLDGMTFSGRILVDEGKGGRQVEMDIAKGEASNCLVVGCTGLPEGGWSYEVFCTSNEGLRERMLSGYISVIGSLEASSVLDDRPTAEPTGTGGLEKRTRNSRRRERTAWMPTSSAVSPSHRRKNCRKKANVASFTTSPTPAAAMTYTPGWTSRTGNPPGRPSVNPPSSRPPSAPTEPSVSVRAPP